jgi:hypothetical protein
MALEGKKEMTQYVYILKEKEKSKGWNPPENYKGDFPPFKYVATNGQGMVQVLASVWKENKIAEYVVFTDGTNEVKFKMMDIPTILSSHINSANISPTPLGWLMNLNYDTTIKK